MYIHIGSSVLCQCVVLTDADLELQKAVNRYCHTHNPPIMVWEYMYMQHTHTLATVSLLLPPSSVHLLLSTWCILQFIL